MRGAKCLAYFLQRKKLTKLITDVTGNNRTDYFNSMHFCLSVAQFFVRLFEITIKANSLQFAAKYRH